MNELQKPGEKPNKPGEYLDKTHKLIKSDDKNYFFVFQNKSYERELNGGFLWAPQYAKDGRKVSHWVKMKEVRKGDIIIHSYNSKIVAISIAQNETYDSEIPKELHKQWNNKGWKVNTKYFTIENPIKTLDFVDELIKLQPKNDGPFNSNKMGKQGYLFSANRKMFEFLINESIKNQNNYSEKIKLLNLLKNKEDFMEEYKIENKLNEEIDYSLSQLSEDEFEYNPEPIEKSNPLISSGNKIYPRNKNASLNALIRAEYKCEIDPEHPSFIRKNNNKNYTESHHLIPMAYQDLFDNSLDVEANIVSLCSNCHNQIHYGRDSEKLIEKLYKKREEELKKAGIWIKLEAVLCFYK